MKDHDQLSGALHALADDGDTPDAPVAELLRRGRRTTRNARILGTSVAAVGLVAAVGAATAFAGAQTQHNPPPNATGGRPHHTTSASPHHTTSASPQATAVAPPMQLVAAVRKTAGTTFQVASYADWDSPDRQTVGPDCTGGSDPKHQASWMAGPQNTGIYIKVIGDDFYRRSVAGTAGGPSGWKKVSAKEVKGSGRDSFFCGGMNTITVSGVLDEMKKEGPVTSLGVKQKDGKDFNVYSVTSTKPVIGDGSYDRTQAWVGVKSGYVEQVWSWEAPKGATASPSVNLYSHFGDPVTVERP